MQKWFSDGQGRQNSLGRSSRFIRKIIRPLRKSCKNEFPAFKDEQQISNVSQVFFREVLGPQEIMQEQFCGGQGRTHNLRSFSSFFLCIFRPSENHEKTFFRASLEPQGPRDPPCVKERTNQFRIALTRALYDQIRP